MLGNIENVLWVGVFVLLQEVANVGDKLTDLVVVLGDFPTNLLSLFSKNTLYY